MKKFLTFIAGMGVGVAISWSYHKNKYEEMVREEVESLRETKKKKEESGWDDSYTPTEDDIVKYHNGQKTQTDEDIDNTAEEVYEKSMERAKNIINYNKYSSSDKNEEVSMKNPLYIVTPEEFASLEGYDTDTFYIFEDNIITNDNNEVIDNVRETFGLTVEEIRSQFGVYEDNAVYIRNEKIQTDYEILRELDTYDKRNGE